jgi:serine/threonine-protein phosphatase 6 regulatory ankyrin repeat subunit B
MECLFDADKPHFAAWLWIYAEERGGSMETMCSQKPGAAPLYYAAWLGFRDLAEHLIAEHPEQVNARGWGEVTPMHAAAAEGHTNILSLLLDHGVDVDLQGGVNGATPLQRALWNGKLEAGQYLLHRGADINARNQDNWTALFCAVFEGHVEFARMLLKRGAVVDDRATDGKTPLHWAVITNSIQAMRLLLEHGADVNVRNKKGNTPFQLAVSREAKELLSEFGGTAGSVK